MTMKIPFSVPASDRLAELLPADGDRAVLVETPELLVGVKRFAPGEVFQNHFHEDYDEYFVGLSGCVTVWQGRKLASELAPGTSLLCTRGSHHAIVNSAAEPAMILFVKAGIIADDTTWVPFAHDVSAPSSAAEGTRS